MLVHQADQLRTALSPVRRQLLDRMHQPTSAPRLAKELGLGRQKVGYHLKALEDAGLVELVEERPRRGCTERVLKAKAGALVIDPLLMSQDTVSADHLVATAATTVRDVARMQAAADEQGKRLLTFTLEADVRLKSPADLDRFATALAKAVEGVAAQFDTPRGRHYRIVAGGYPTPKARP